MFPAPRPCWDHRSSSPPAAGAASGQWRQRGLQGQVCPVPWFGEMVPMGSWQLGRLPPKQPSRAGGVPRDVPWEGAVALRWGGVTFPRGHEVQLTWQWSCEGPVLLGRRGGEPSVDKPCLPKPEKQRPEPRNLKSKSNPMAAKGRWAMSRDDVATDCLMQGVQAGGGGSWWQLRWVEVAAVRRWLWMLEVSRGSGHPAPSGIRYSPSRGMGSSSAGWGPVPGPAGQEGTGGQAGSVG